MNQTKAARMHPGAFRSCLIPFTDQILDWWYDDLLTAAEIQRRLKAEGLDVARTTVMRFIKVREQRAAKRKRPAALRRKLPPKTPSVPAKPLSLALETASPEPPVLSSRNRQEGERFLQFLKNTTTQELGRMADEAREMKRKEDFLSE